MAEEVAIEELVYRSYIVRYMVHYLSYVKVVGEKVGWPEALRLMEKVHWELGRSWFKENRVKLDIDTEDARAGLILTKRALKSIIPVIQDPESYRVVEERQNRAVLRVSGWCPILEATKQVGLNNEEIYTHTVRPYIEAMIKSLNPKLGFEITRFRPESNCYEFVIELQE